MSKHILGLMAATSMFTATANSAAAESFDDFILKSKPILDYRLRFENVDQTGIAKKADAVTSRMRAGFETAAMAETKFLVDFNWISALSENYNNTVNGNTSYPVVADPKGAKYIHSQSDPRQRLFDPDEPHVWRRLAGWPG